MKVFGRKLRNRSGKAKDKFIDVLRRDGRRTSSMSSLSLGTPPQTPYGDVSFDEKALDTDTNSRNSVVSLSPPPGATEHQNKRSSFALVQTTQVSTEQPRSPRLVTPTSNAPSSRPTSQLSMEEPRPILVTPTSNAPSSRPVSQLSTEEPRLRVVAPASNAPSSRPVSQLSTEEPRLRVIAPTSNVSPISRPASQASTEQPRPKAVIPTSNVPSITSISRPASQASMEQPRPKAVIPTSNVPSISRPTSQVFTEEPRPKAVVPTIGVPSISRPISQVSTEEPRPKAVILTSNVPSISKTSPVTASVMPTIPERNASRRPRPSLWEKEYTKLSNEDRKAIPFTDEDKRDYLDRFVTTTMESRNACQKGELKFQFGGKTIVARDLAEEVLSCVESLRATVDTTVQHDLGHVALPWTALRLLLQVALSETESMGAVLFGVERTTRIVARCEVYEECYIWTDSKPTNFTSIEDTLSEIYAAVLQFLIGAKRASRTTGELLGPKGLKNYLEKVDECEKRLVQEAEVAEKQNQKLNRENKNDRIKKLKAVLDGTDSRPRAEKTQENPTEPIPEMVEDDRREEILTWLSTTEYEGHHKNATEGLLENTGEWLQKNEGFQKWKSSDASEFFWLHGIAGAGKTKLTCMAVNSFQSALEDSRKAGRNEALIYFYCRGDEYERYDPTKILQSFVKQLSLQTREHGLPAALITKYEERPNNGKAKKQLSFYECTSLIGTLFEGYSQTTIVIDGLDEVNQADRGRLLQALSSIACSKTSLNKIFISSRDQDDINDALKDAPRACIGTENMGDIGRFVDREVAKAISGKKLLGGEVDENLQSCITSTLSKEANGMFLWTDLQIKRLCGIITPSEVEAELKQLPMDLTNTYSLICHSIRGNTETEELAWKALMWVMCARGALTPEKWISAVSWLLITPGGHPEQFPLSKLLEVCQNLVVFDHEQNLVRFAHLSVREFLETNGLLKEQREFANPDEVAAEACLAVMQHPNKSSSGSSASWDDMDPFHKYAICYWGDHVRYINNTFSPF